MCIGGKISPPRSASRFCAERLIHYFPGLTIDELAERLEKGEKKRMADETLDDLITYWKDYRANKGLGFGELEKVNNTILLLENYRNQSKQGGKISQDDQSDDESLGEG